MHFVKINQNASFDLFFHENASRQHSLWHIIKSKNWNMLFLD